MLFESYERRIGTIQKVLDEYGFDKIEDTRDYCLSKGIDVYEIVKGVQPIAFENATWAYTLGCAIALKKGSSVAADAAEAIGIGLQAFCIPGSVAETRSVGIGHGNLGAMLLREETSCFCFRHCQNRQQGAQKSPARYVKRLGQRRRLHHLPYQRLHLCGDRV
jgi:hypothetical protein